MGDLCSDCGSQEHDGCAHLRRQQLERLIIDPRALRRVMSTYGWDEEKATIFITALDSHHLICVDCGSENHTSGSRLCEAPDSDRSSTDG